MSLGWSLRIILCLVAGLVGLCCHWFVLCGLHCRLLVIWLVCGLLYGSVVVLLYLGCLIELV